jgi:hypothetical protein
MTAKDQETKRYFERARWDLERKARQQKSVKRRL